MLTDGPTDRQTDRRTDRHHQSISRNCFAIRPTKNDFGLLMVIKTFSDTSIGRSQHAASANQYPTWLSWPKVDRNQMFITEYYL